VRGLIPTVENRSAKAAALLLCFLLTSSPSVLAASKNGAPAPQSKVTQLDEATLNQMGKAFTHAVANKDIATLGSGLSDDIDITIEIMGLERHLTKAEYLANFQRSWAAIKDYEFKPTSGEMEVSLDSPTRATFRFSAIETMLNGGIIIKGLSEQENVVELRNGRPQMVKATVHVSVYASVKL